MRQHTTPIPARCRWPTTFVRTLVAVTVVLSAPAGVAAAAPFQGAQTAARKGNSYGERAIDRDGDERSPDRWKQGRGPVETTPGPGPGQDSECQKAGSQSGSRIGHQFVGCQTDSA